MNNKQIQKILGLNIALGLVLLIAQIVMCLTVKGCYFTNQSLPVVFVLVAICTNMLFLLHLLKSKKLELEKVKVLPVSLVMVFCCLAVFEASHFWKNQYLSRSMVDGPLSAD